MDVATPTAKIDNKKVATLTQGRIRISTTSAHGEQIPSVTEVRRESESARV